MPVPLIDPNIRVTADDWWNPLSQLANDNEADIAAEISARGAAITSEANTRAAADTAEATTRATNDTAEATTRAANDTTETNARTAADTAINNRLNSTIASTGISDLPSWKTTVDTFITKAPVPRYKGVIETLNNSTTMQNDNDLVWPVATGALYLFDMILFYDSSVTADLKIQFTAPAASALVWGGIGLDTALAFKSFGSIAAGTAVTFGGAGAGLVRTIHIGGMLVTAGTAGNLTLQWAQNVLEVSDTRMLNGSFGHLNKAA